MRISDWNADLCSSDLIGPINNAAQYARVLELIEDARDKGYTFLVGGEAADVPGYFIPVTILDNPPEDSRIVQEEQFGPVLPLIKFDDFDDVVARANRSEERRVGDGCVRPCRTRWSPIH